MATEDESMPNWAIDSLTRVFAPPVSPPSALRDSILVAAKRIRSVPAPEVTELAIPYAEQVHGLVDLLGELEPAQLRLPSPRHHSIAGVIEHLADNDGRVAADLGFVPAAEIAAPIGTRSAGAVDAGWRRQSQVLLRNLVDSGPAILERPVHLAGKQPSKARLGDALVQRTFETWIHCEDIRLAVGRTKKTPRPDHLGLIAEFILRMLPAAMAAKDVTSAVSVRLTGCGPGDQTSEWTAGPGEPVARVTADAAEFCRLCAGRVPVSGFSHTLEGDSALAATVLRIAATLGCD